MKQLQPDNKIKAYIMIEDLTDEEYQNSHYLVFCTKEGVIKKTSVEAFSRPRANGINAITIKDGDSLLEVKLTNGESEILIANRNGRAIRFPEGKVRPMGRSAAGVRGITLDGTDDEVVGMICADPNDLDFSVLVISEKGFGKRSGLEEYRVTNRGGKGVRTMKVTDKTGKVVTLKGVSEADALFITTDDGIIIRTKVSDLRVMGRATQGVRVIRLANGQSIADVAILKGGSEGDEEE